MSVVLQVLNWVRDQAEKESDLQQYVPHLQNNTILRLLQQVRPRTHAYAQIVSNNDMRNTGSNIQLWIFLSVLMRFNTCESFDVMVLGGSDLSEHRVQQTGLSRAICGRLPAGALHR